MSNSALGTVFFTIIGMFFVYIANRQAAKRKKLQLIGLQVDGLIVWLEKEKSPDSGCTYPVVEFITLERQTMVVQYNLGTQPASYYLGQQVAVLYNPAEPSEFVLNPNNVAWEVYIFGILGVSSIIFGLYFEIKM